jgi:hypothetical protein
MKSRRQVKFEFKNGKYQPRLLESHVLKEIVDRLWLQAKIKVWQVRERIPGHGVPSTPGIPDLIGWIPKGVMISYPDKLMEPFEKAFATPLFIEVKRPGGAHRLAQTQFIDEAVQGGCCAFFAESWQDVVSELASVGVVLKDID